MPRPVLDALTAAQLDVEADPARATYGPGMSHLEKVRAKAAALVNADRRGHHPHHQRDQGMFLIAQGLKLTHGDHVLTTDHEHPGGRLGWEWAARRYHIEVDAIPIAPDETDAQAIVERFADRILPRTRVISISHVLFTTGVKLPVAELCALAREHGCKAVIDGAQGPGAMPVDVRALGCHAYASSGHKWLLGPKGHGLSLHQPGNVRRARCLAAGGGTQPGIRTPPESSTSPDCAAMGAAIDYVQALGPDRIAAHNAALRRELHDELSRFNQVRIPAPAEGPMTSANLAFCLPDSADLHAIRRNLVHATQNLYPHRRAVRLQGPARLAARLQWLGGCRRLVDALREELAA